MIDSFDDVTVGKDGSSARLAATAGATTQVLESLSNRGAHPVTITSIETDDIVSAVQWSSYRTVPGGAVSGKSAPWKAFPAVVPRTG